jgi:hypothetical protein
MSIPKRQEREYLAVVKTVEGLQDLIHSRLTTTAFKTLSQSTRWIKLREKFTNLLLVDLQKVITFIEEYNNEL